MEQDINTVARLVCETHRNSYYPSWLRTALGPLATALSRINRFSYDLETVRLVCANSVPLRNVLSRLQDTGLTETEVWLEGPWLHEAFKLAEREKAGLQAGGKSTELITPSKAGRLEGNR